MLLNCVAAYTSVLVRTCVFDSLFLITCLVDSGENGIKNFDWQHSDMALQFLFGFLFWIGLKILHPAVGGLYAAA